MRPVRAFGGQRFQVGQVRSVDVKARGRGLARLLPAVQSERGGDAGTRRELGHARGMVDGVPGHAAIGRPLASGDRDQPGVRDDDGVLARELRGRRAPRPLGADQRPEAGEQALDIGPSRGASPGNAPRGPAGSRSPRPAAAAREAGGRWRCRWCPRASGRARGSRTGPGRRRCCGIMMAVSPGRNDPVEDEVGPLARARSSAERSGSSSRRISSAKTPVALTTALAGIANVLARLLVARLDAGDPAVALDQPADRHVIQGDAAEVGQRCGPGRSPAARRRTGRRCRRSPRAAGGRSVGAQRERRRPARSSASGPGPDRPASRS